MTALHRRLPPPADLGSILTTPARDTWRRRSACARLDPSHADALFFGGPRGRFNPDDLATARAVCDACPVQWDCLDSTLSVPAQHDRYGVVAGLLPGERATLREEAPRREPYRGDVWTGGDPDGERLPRLGRRGAGAA